MEIATIQKPHESSFFPSGERIIPFEVQGDAMTGEGIHPSDLVFYVPGTVDGNGLYVIEVNERQLVRRIDFHFVDSTVSVISHGPKGVNSLEFPMDHQEFTILGKIKALLHNFH